MDIFGIGPMEGVMILVVALLFMGPDRMVDLARRIMGAVNEFRRTVSDVSKVMEKEISLKETNEHKETSKQSKEKGEDPP